MTVNIFGVGRSGTKAVMLYLAYHALRKADKVWLNYEPYLWQHRKGTFSAIGQSIFLDSNFILNPSEQFEKEHARFLQGLVDHEGVIINKFIRGNGFIPQINEITKPDHTVLIIRPLQDIINSLSARNWDFLKVFYSRYTQGKKTTFWEEFVKAMTPDLLNDLPFPIEEAKTELKRNSIYWYLMNKSLINYYQSQPKNCHLIRYEHLEELAQINQQIFPVPPEEELLSPRCEVFRGDNIHLDYPLEDQIPYEAGKMGYLFNQWKFKMNWNWGTSIKYQPETIGSYVQLNSKVEIHRVSPELDKKRKKAVSQNEMVYTLQEAIDQELKALHSRV